LALAAWQPGWDNDDDDAVDDGALDEDSDVGGYEETKTDDTLVVGKTAVATRDVNTPTAEDNFSNDGESPPLLSNSPSPEPSLVAAPAALRHNVAVEPCYFRSPL